MKKILLLLAAAATIALAEPFVIATGGESGNYFAMGKDIAKYCGKIADIEVAKSTGSIQNLEDMTNKRAEAAIVQVDVLMSMAKNMPRSVNQQSMKVIAGLHVETIHLLVPNDYKPKQSGFFSKFSAAKPVTSINDLKGIEVVSSGGSLVSAMALNEFFNLDWTVTSAPDLVKANLPILLVGGVPYKPVETILATGKYHLVSIPYESVRASQPFYTKSDITYTVNSQPMRVETVGVQAMLIGKYYRSEARNLTMEKLASCIDKNIAEMSDDGSTNPNWNNVFENQKLGNLVNWAFFNLK